MTHWTEAAFVRDPTLFGHYLDERVESADDEVEALLELLRREYDLRPDGALDVACGIGRHATALARREVDVIGVDLSSRYVERARNRAREAGISDAASFVVGDMRDLDAVGGSHDLVLNMWTSFGYFDDGTNREVLAAMRRRVGEGGALVLDVVNKEGLLADFEETTVAESGDRLSTEVREYDPVTSRMRVWRQEFEVKDGDYDHLGELRWDHRVYAPIELIEQCESVGFGDVAVHGDLEGDSLERTSRRLVVVARP